MSARWKHRLIIGAVVVIGLFVVFPAVPPFYSRRAQIDVNSGRERIQHTYFGIRGNVTPLGPFFGDLTDQLQPLGPPQWETYHYSALYNGARINYRTGRLRSGLRGTTLGFEWAESHEVPVPVPHRIQMAQAGLAELASQRACNVDLDDNGGFTVLDEEQNVIGRWDPTAAR